MGGFSSVCIYDDLPSCESSISMWASDNELPRGVYKELNVASKDFLHLLGVLSEDSREEDMTYILSNSLLHCFISHRLCLGGGILGSHEVVMLCTDDDGIYA